MVECVNGLIVSTSGSSMLLGIGACHLASYTMSLPMHVLAYSLKYSQNQSQIGGTLC